MSEVQLGMNVVMNPIGAPAPLWAVAGLVKEKKMAWTRRQIQLCCCCSPNKRKRGVPDKGTVTRPVSQELALSQEGR